MPATSKSITGSKDRDSSPATQVVELKDLVVGYAKQETVDPLKTLGRYLGFGISGSLFIGAGVCFLLLALLRGLQTIEVLNDTDEVSGGTFSWAPYLITSVVGLIFAGMFLARLISLNRKRESR